MALILWTDAMSVGVPELDADHRVLIGVINQIETGAKPRTGRDLTAKCLMQLRRYAEFHFAREEQVMRACNFPGIADHRQEHGKFAQTVKDMTERFERDPEASIGDEMLTFLKEWLHHHILEVDMAYKPFAEGNADAQQAARSFKALEVWWD